MWSGKGCEKSIPLVFGVHLWPAVGRLSLLLRRTNPMFCFIKNPPKTHVFVASIPWFFPDLPPLSPLVAANVWWLTQAFKLTGLLANIAMIHRSQPFFLDRNSLCFMDTSQFFYCWPHSWRFNSNFWLLTTLTLLGFRCFSPTFLHG